MAPNAGGYTYDTEYPGDAYVLIAVKPNPDNKGQLYTETTIVKGPERDGARWRERQR